MKLGETVFGVTVWAVLAAREPGQRNGLVHLTWKGPGDAICLHADGVSDGQMEHFGPWVRTVSGPCLTQAGAEHAVAAFLAGLDREPVPGNAPAAGRVGSPHPAPSAEATGATAVPAAEPVADETVLILAARSPEKWLQYTLWEARRHRRDANEAAGNQLAADGDTVVARQRNVVANEAAHGRWAAEAAAVIAEYARAIGAEPPAIGGADDGTSPYNRGWGNGHRMIEAGITRRSRDYDDVQWREYVAGYAAGFRDAARSAVVSAEAICEQARRDHENSAHEVIQIPLSPEMAAYHAELSARFAAISFDEGQLLEPAPKRVPGELTEGPGRIDSTVPPLTDGRAFPHNLADGVPCRTAPAQPAASQPNGPASLRRRTP